MSLLLSVAKSFVFCSFAVLLIHILTPKGNTEKIISLVLIAFTLLSLIAPLKSIGKISSFSFASAEQTDSITGDESGSLIRTEIRALTDKALNSINIDNYELIIRTDETNQEEVIIEEFKIYVEDVSEKESIINAVKNETDLIPEVFEMDEYE